MKPTRNPLRVAAVGASLALALAVGACTPEPPAGCVEEPGTVTSGPVTLTVSQATCLEPGDVVTVTGSGYTTTGNLGSRPPFAGKPAGVYVVLGELAETWRPSELAPGSARKVITQQWAVTDPTFSESTNQELPYVLLAADGTFTSSLTVGEPTGSNPNLGFATYAGSGAVNAGEELLVPASWAPEDPADPAA